MLKNKIHVKINTSLIFYLKNYLIDSNSVYFKEEMINEVQINLSIPYLSKINFHKNWRIISLKGGI